MVEKKSAKAKSTPKKRATKKVKEPKPVSDVQQVVEPVKPREINWDVIGFSSAAVALVGASVFFWIGWVYEATWYGYFGVSMNLIQLPIYEIVAQSVPSVLTILAIISGIYALAILIRTLFFDVEKSVLEDLFSIRLIIESVTPYVFLIFLLIVSIFVIYLITGNSEFSFDITSLAILVMILSLFLGFRGLVDIFKLLPHKITAIYIIGGLPKNYRINDTFIRNSMISLVILFSSALVSGYVGLADAKTGNKIYAGAGWNIQPVLLVTRQDIRLSGFINQTCDTSGCISGPFGMLGENNDSFILIKWEKDKKQGFNYQPGLYIIPKSENNYLIPYTASEAFPTSSTTTPLLGQP